MTDIGRRFSGLLISVLAAQVPAYFVLETSVVVVDGCPQSSLGGVSLGPPLQNALQITHALGVNDKLHGCERFVVGENRLHTRKTHEAAFQRIVWNFLLCLKELGQAASA